MERIEASELHKRMKAQGVSGRDHIAFKCPVCSTVQSMASLVRAGAPADKVENYIGFSCEGRFSNAGPLWTARQRHSRSGGKRCRFATERLPLTISVRRGMLACFSSARPALSWSRRKATAVMSTTCKGSASVSQKLTQSAHVATDERHHRLQRHDEVPGSGQCWNGQGHMIRPSRMP